MFEIWQIKGNARTQLRKHRLIPALITLVAGFLYFIPFPPQVALASGNTRNWSFHRDFDFFDLYDFYYNTDLLNILRNTLLSVFTDTIVVRTLLLEVLTVILFSSILIALYRYYVSFSINSSKTSFNTFLEGLTQWWKSILANLYVTWRLFLWSLLFVAVVTVECALAFLFSGVLAGIIGIVAAFAFSGLAFSVFFVYKSISYSQIFFVLAEYPTITLRKALKTSVAITKGARGKLFVLGLSFIGWGFLCLFTVGIGYLFLVPYMAVSYANAYRALKQRAFDAGILVKKAAPKMGEAT
jgi:uncharacterized membrane protein